ncbi:MAG TPA: GvpL/GvpF family gas vesicle protein [Terriglobales bacterium]|nr:GvpL/GvpF family gas vesicle protein [Terriglobales bacterium]
MLLLYGMTKSGTPAPPFEGVGGEPLRSLDEQGITAWHSNAAPTRGAKEDVLAFHRVISALFQAATVIPFRMPTLLPGEPELRAWLAANAATILRELERLRGVVQMELHIAAPAPAAAGSGRAYLESRRDAQRALAERAAAAREALADLAAEWRQRETRDGIRCFALVPRGRERDFVSHLDASGRRDDLRVTGPWPPAEFLDPALTTPA